MLACICFVSFERSSIAHIHIITTIVYLTILIEHKKILLSDIALQITKFVSYLRTNVNLTAEVALIFI